MIHETVKTSRRSLVLAGAAGTFGMVVATAPALAADKGDLAILQAAYDLESQGIWAYSAAGGKLTSTDVGKTVLALALRNQADHKAHRVALGEAIKSLGGTPVTPKDKYDLSAYIKADEGGLDSDVNIAKLALALEVDAALAYQGAFGKLKSPGIAAAALSILPIELSHAAAIRSVFHTLIPSVEAVPASFLNADTRKEWVLHI
jgi:Ferritin-like domain